MSHTQEVLMKHQISTICTIAVFALCLTSNTQAMYPAVNFTIQDESLDYAAAGKGLLIQELLVLGQCNNLQHLQDALRDLAASEKLKTAISMANLLDTKKEALTALVDELRGTLQAIDDETLAMSEEELLPQEEETKWKKCRKRVCLFLPVVGVPLFVIADVIAFAYFVRPLFLL